MKVHTRLMQQSDVEKIVSIYNLIIEERIATFNVELIDSKSAELWNDEGIVLVAEFENEVVGFVRSYPYSGRTCYQWNFRVFYLHSKISKEIWCRRFVDGKVP